MQFVFGEYETGLELMIRFINQRVEYLSGGKLFDLPLHASRKGILQGVGCKDCLNYIFSYNVVHMRALDIGEWITWHHVIFN